MAQELPQPLVNPVQTVQAKDADPGAPVASTPPAKKEVKTASRNDHGPKIDFEKVRFNFGEIYHADKVQHEFQFINKGDRDLEIKGARASCGCTTPSYPFLPIKPGDKGFIGVTYNSVGKQGAQKATIRVATNDPDKPEVVLYLSGRVLVKPLAEKNDNK